MKSEIHHRRPRHIAEKLERFVGISMAAMGLVLLVVLLVGVTQTGTTAPQWMH